MTLDPATTRLADLPVSGWTGPIEFELHNGRGWGIGTAELAVRRDLVVLRFVDRVLAVMDRDRFREWLIHPREPMEVDDVVWSTEAGVTCVTIDGRLHCSVPEVAIATFLGLV